MSCKRNSGYRRGLPGQCLRETYEALRPIYLKYVGMKKSHMNKYRVIGLMIEAFDKAIKPRKETP